MNSFNKAERFCEWLFSEYRNINKRYKSNKSNIVLGRTFSLGGMAGYELAKQLFNRTKYSAVVDPPLTIKGRKNPLYPDILVTKGDKLKAIIEMKIDLGFLNQENYGISYQKEKKEYTYSKKENNFKKNMAVFSKAKHVKYNLKDEYGHIIKTRLIKVPKKFEKIMIVVSKINHRKRAPFFEKAMDDSGFKILFLLETTHPNNPRYSLKAVKKDLQGNQNKINKAFKWI